MSKTNAARGLGRGFDTLIPSDLDATALLNQSERIQNLLISKVIPNREQPRIQFDERALEELADSIKHYGVLQPIIVSPLEQDKYTIIAGERRWRAAAMAGLERIPCIVRTIAALEQLEVALIENVQRVDLAPLEQAISIERLHQQFNMTYVDIATRLSKAPTTINNIVRLLHLPPDARIALQQSKITEGHARAILALKAQVDLQARLLDLIISQGWSVRQAEQFVTAHKEGLKTSSAVHQRAVKETSQTKSLGKKLDTKVTIHHTARGGRLEIHFKNDEQLENLYKKIGN